MEIEGYRELSTEEIELINTITEMGNHIDYLIEQFSKTEAIDKRWLNIAKTDLQKGFMALNRSISKPTTF